MDRKNIFENPAEEDMGFLDKLDFNEKTIEESADLRRTKIYPKEKMPERTDYSTEKNKKID